MNDWLRMAKGYETPTDTYEKYACHPETFLGIGYTKDRAGLPLEAVRVPVPQPGADQVLIRVVASSLNPLEYKLAELNFFGGTPPVVLGLDLSGVVVAIGSAVRDIAVGDSVVAVAHIKWRRRLGRRSWGRRRVCARERVPDRPQAGIPELSPWAALPMCFLSAFAGLYGKIQAGETVYIPGGGGGVGHLAVQMAARVLRARLVISSGSTPQSISQNVSSSTRRKPETLSFSEGDRSIFLGIAKTPCVCFFMLREKKKCGGCWLAARVRRRLKN